MRHEWAGARPSVLLPALPAWPAALLLAAGLAAPGCRTPVGVQEVGGDRVYREVNASALTLEAPSEASTQVLARHNLLDLHSRKPEAALGELHERARRENSRDDLFALAELSYLAARDDGGKGRYLASVIYAYLYLFGPGSQGQKDAYDPRFRLACDLYNRALTEFLRSRDGEIVIADGDHAVPFGRVEVRASRPGFPWGPEEFNRFLPAYDYRVRGLRSRQRKAGLGVALIACRTPPRAEKAASDFMGERARVPASAFLRISIDPRQPLKGDFQASIELHAPFDVQELLVEGRPVPLETDLTAPLAHHLEERLIWKFELGGFMSSEKAEFKPGIYMLQPHARGKVPVLFVHGTASSPARWAETFNELQAYPEVREGFQFWFFLCPTGNPIAYSGSLLREALRHVVETLDPGGSDPALRRMVLVGHSQGGILTRMQVIDSGDRLWKLVFDRDVEQLDLPQESKDLLRRCLIFRPAPYVRRVVFLATPHRGSFLAGGILGRISSYFITMPGKLVKLGQDLLEKNEAHILRRAGASRKMPTSITNMTPANPFLKELCAIPISPEVKVHSIIPVKGNGPVAEGNDGVVEYRSAHLEGVESELVVRTGHSCQSHPLAIAELRRILMEHLREAAARPGS